MDFDIFLIFLNNFSSYEGVGIWQWLKGKHCADGFEIFLEILNGNIQHVETQLTLTPSKNGHFIRVLNVQKVVLGLTFSVFII